MNTAVKVGLFAAVATGIGLLLYKGTQTATEWANKLSVSFTSVAKPAFKLGLLTLPVNVQINNPTPLFAPIDSVKIRLLRSGLPFGETQPSAPFQIESNTVTPLTLYPTITLKNILPQGNILAQVTNVLSNQNPVVDFVTEITVRIQGYDIVINRPTKLYLTDLLNAR